MTARYRSGLKLSVKIIKYTLGIFFAFVCLIALMLASAYQDIFQAAQAAWMGKDALNNALVAVQNKDWDRASSLSLSGQESFVTALDYLDLTRDNIAVKFVPPITTQINDIEYLLQTGEVLGRSLNSITPLLKGADQIRYGTGSGNFYDLPAADKEKFIKYIFESEPELAGLLANLQLALMNLDRIHRVGVLWPVYSQISDIRDNLEQAVKLLEITDPLVKLLPALVGYPQTSRFLIIMQNNDELRPAGGFVGVYGRLDVKSGEIKHLETDDSYHIDMPASISDKWQLAPPPVLAKYLEVEKWYFRDANWSPDWPQSARQLEYVYNGVIGVSGQTAEPFTAVIGITPDLISNLIGLVGPIEVRGETYTADNFQSLLQYNVEVAYREKNISQWDRKDVIDEVLAELKLRLFNLPTDKLNGLLDIASASISERDFQIYFPNTYWQSVAKELGASGEVAQTESDFLMVVDANLAAFKSDSVMIKDIAYQVTETPRGLEARVRLNYKHEGGFDWRTTRYRSYTRVFVPLGSRLVSLDGVDEATANPMTTEEKELDKTSFGFFFTVEPGAEREITLSYTLPDYIAEQWQAGKYELLIQKQAGRRTRELAVDFVPITGRARSLTSGLETDKYFK